MSSPNFLRWVAVAMLLAGASAWAADDYSEVLKASADLPELRWKALDLAKLAAEDQINDLSGAPRRFAVGHKVDYSTDNAGSWERGADGIWTWRLKLHAAEAVHLNFGFSRFALPEGAELLIVGGDGKSALGPFTRAQMLEHGQLWTPVLGGERAVLQLRVSAKLVDQVDLQLSHIGHGYRGFGHRSKVCKSGSCNTDVACLSEGDPWNSPRRSVGAYTRGGVDACTGSLVNNTANDRRMLFLTATHCGVSNDSIAASMVVYWNYESPTCRVPGSAESGMALPKPTTTTAGLRFLAATENPFDDGMVPPGDRSDHTLVELATPAPGSGFNLHWSGWDRRPPPTTCSAPSDPSSTAGLCASIHHPSVDEKRITFVESPMLLGNISNATDVHWTANWDPTPPLLPNISPMPTMLPPSVTEQGSSGSPLYNADRRLIGVLSGGASFCGVSSAGLNDEYGGLFHAWEGLGTAQTRMRDHLDPMGVNPEFINGIDECTGATLEASVSSTTPAPGDDVIFSVDASGTPGPYTFDWDVDGDGVIDRSGLGLSQLTTRYPRTGAVNPQVVVTDAAGCPTAAFIPLTVSGPEPTLDGFDQPTQLCGNDDADIDPGERWAVPLNFSNPGSANALSLVAMLGKQAVGDLDGGPDDFGYTFGDNSGGSCAFQFIDLSDSVDALPLLASSIGFPAEDDGSTEDIVLGDFAFEAYGEVIERVRMSTNGYISAQPDATGGDFRSECPMPPDDDEDDVRLNVQHEDMITADGLRSASFASCPRPAEVGAADQPCVVFQWSGMGLFQSSGVPNGSIDYQAVVYPASKQITYQYQDTLSGLGADADISIYGGPGRSSITYSCKAAVLEAGRSVCFFHPDFQPSRTDLGVVRLETPALQLGNLAAEASISESASFQVDADAPCGGAFSLAYRGAAFEGGFAAGGASQRIDFAADEQCQVVTECPAQLKAIDLNDGAFFERSRPGNGLVSHVIPVGPPEQPPTFFAAWYTGERNRNNTWYILQEALIDGQVVSPILQFSRNISSPTWSVSSVNVGRAEVTLLDANKMAFYWELNGQAHGEVLDQLFASSGASPGSPDRTGAWFWPPESGWGLTVDSFNLGDTEQDFTIVYHYDDAGFGRWTLSQAFISQGGPIPAVNYQVHCPGCPWLDINPTAVGVGTMTRVYNSPSDGTFSTDFTLQPPLSGSWLRNEVPIMLITQPRP